MLRLLETGVEGSRVSEAAQEHMEELRKATAGEQEVDQLAVAAVELVAPPHRSSEQIKTPDEAHFSLVGRIPELSVAEDNAGVEEEEWEMVNCSLEEGLDLVLRSDLTQAQSDSGLDQEGAVLKVEQVFIMDDEEDLEVRASEVMCLVVTEKTSKFEDTSSDSYCKKPPESALQTLCLEKGAHECTSVPFPKPSNMLGIASEEPLVFSVECKQNLPAHTAQILRENTEYKKDQGMQTSRIVKVDWKETSGPEDEVHQYIPLDRKKEQSSSLLQRERAAQSTDQESEIQILTSPSGTPNRAETFTSTKGKTCQCCTVM